MHPGTKLSYHVDALGRAVADRDDQGFYQALHGLADAAQGAAPDEVQAALTGLEPLLAGIPLGIGGDLAQLVGSVAEYGTDPAVVLPTLVTRAVEAMELAVRFAELYGAACGELPRADDPEAIGPTIDAFVRTATGRGGSESEASALVQAWFCGEEWIQPVLYLAQREDVRAALPDRQRLLAAVEAVREHLSAAHWLHGLLLVLDDEPLIVLHRETGRGFRLTISGIGDNFQLHTLLAATLIGDESRGLLPGRRPSPAEIAAASDGECLEVDPCIHGAFNLVDAEGAWIWNEGRPADIPKFDGVRVIVLDPQPYQRTWNPGRVYPLMPPSITIDEILPRDEAARWLGRVRPARRG